MWEDIFVLIRTLWVVLTTLTLTFGSQAAASSLTDQFTSFWVLGDSLSDDGSNIAKATNGDVWNEAILADFTSVYGASAAGNYAYAGATSAVTHTSPNPILDIEAQVDLLLANELSNFGTDPLVSIWIGGNDLDDIQNGTITAADTVASYANALQKLIFGGGVTNFLAFEIPNIAYSPLIQDAIYPDQATKDATVALVTQSVAGLNAAFQQVRDSLSAFASFTVIPAFDIPQQAYLDPTFFGVPRTGPCVVRSATGLNVVDDCTQTAFWDNFHPAEALHDYTTAQVYAAYATPVPLPAAGWLLIGAFGGMAFIGRRRAAAA